MSNLLSKISVVTGIKYNTLASISEKNGIHHLLKHPRAAKELTSAEKIKLQGLADFVSVWQETEFLHENTVLDSSSKAGEFCVKKLSLCQVERFEAIFLDTQNNVISAETMFYGTLCETAVYPREIVKRALDHDAHSVMVAHNHPSGGLKPSTADIRATETIKNALTSVDIKLVDHIIVGNTEYTSFAEKGLL